MRKIFNKPRNSGTQTESAFWSFISSKLRRASMYWLPIKECREGCRKPYEGTSKRRKWSYLCSICNIEYDAKAIEIDHIIPVGSLKSSKDLEGYVERLFTEKGFRCLCKPCHVKVTNAQRNGNN